MGASPSDMLDLVALMDDFSVAPNTASYNLVLKAMHQAKETEVAEKLLNRLDPLILLLFLLYDGYIHFLLLNYCSVFNE